MDNIIKEIHESDIFGNFIETGCGVPVASALLSVAGASSTVYMSECPYSKHYANGKYDNGSCRAVSVENVKRIVDHNIEAFNEHINTVYAASFQVGEDVVTHGWIGLSYKGDTKYYHLTIHEKLSRVEYINRIAQNAIKLIHAKNQSVPSDCDVDIVLNDDLSENKSLCVEFMINSDKDVYLNFTPNGISRLEDSFRDKEDIIIYKGSFNPPTVEHMRIAETTITEHKHMNAAFTFMISVETFSKGTLSLDSVLQRVKWINSMGHGVLLNRKGMFSEAIAFFTMKFGANLFFPIGSDTKERMENSLFSYPHVSYPHYVRTNVSSTIARQYLEDNDFDSLEQIVPSAVLEDLKASGVSSVKPAGS
jgi:hypothetical protein